MQVTQGSLHRTMSCPKQVVRLGMMFGTYLLYAVSQAACGIWHMLVYTLSKLWFCSSHGDLRRLCLGHQMSLLLILCELNPQHIWRKAATWQTLDNLTLAKVDLGGLCCQGCHNVVESCRHVRVRCSWCPGSVCKPSLILLPVWMSRQKPRVWISVWMFTFQCFNVQSVHFIVF